MSRDREFLRYYERDRVEDQLSYYARAAAWHAARNERAIVVTGLLMFAASLASTVVASEWTWLGPGWIWLGLAAVLPAASAAVAATRNLYEHQRNRERFEATRLDLQYLQAYRAPSEKLTDGEYRAALADYVTSIEELLSREHRQWIEIMERAEVEEPQQAESAEP